jgi:hypothetical protein
VTSGNKRCRGLGILNLTNKTRVVSHCGLAIYIDMYLKAKEESWKLKYFTMQKYNLPKILSEKPKSFKISIYEGRQFVLFCSYEIH